MGLVDTGRALLRSGAKAGDKIYVTGTLGNAAAGLQSIFNMLDLPKKDRQFCKKCLNQPVPRLAEGLILKDYASSCIDVSDGLLQDLSHLLRASAVGAKLDTAALPLSPSLLKLDRLQSLHYALSGGDDYELLFTLAEDKEARLFDNTSLQATCIGVITAQTNTIVDQNLKQLKPAGYNHFHV
jgi:thiamine-monophosphate kinase